MTPIKRDPPKDKIQTHTGGGKTSPLRKEKKTSKEHPLDMNVNLVMSAMRHSGIRRNKGLSFFIALHTDTLHKLVAKSIATQDLGFGTLLQLRNVITVILSHLTYCQIKLHNWTCVVYQFDFQTVDIELPLCFQTPAKWWSNR